MNRKIFVVLAAVGSLMMFSGSVNRRQVDVIEYLQEENRILKERLGGKRIQFTDAEGVDWPEKLARLDAEC